MKVVIVGAGGRLGRELVAQFPGCVALTRKDWDLEIPGVSKILKEIRPDIIINAAAKCGVEACAAEPPQAFQINAAVPVELAHFASRSGAALYHISSDYVFDGTKGSPYVETDGPSPVNFYGWSKLMGENASLICPWMVTLRIGSLMGDDLNGIGDVLKQTGNPIQVLRQICTPVTTTTAARLIKQIVDMRAKSTWGNGVFHLGAKQSIWKRDAAICLLAATGRETAVIDNVLPGRPIFAALNCQRVHETFGLQLPNVADELRIVTRFAGYETTDTAFSRLTLQ